MTFTDSQLHTQEGEVRQFTWEESQLLNAVIKKYDRYEHRLYCIGYTFDALDVEDWCIKECERKWGGYNPCFTHTWVGDTHSYDICHTPDDEDAPFFSVEKTDRLTALVELVIQIGEKK